MLALSAAASPLPLARLAPAPAAALTRWLAALDAKLVDHAADVSAEIDLASFARYYVLEELAKDVDGYGLSDYLMLQGGRAAGGRRLR